MTDDRPRRAGALHRQRRFNTATGQEVTGESFPGERMVTELMASALAFTAVVEKDGTEPRRLLEALTYDQLGFFAEPWLDALRAKGYTITVDTDSITFTIVRG